MQPLLPSPSSAPASCVSILLPIMLTKEDSDARPAPLLATQEICPVSCILMPFTVKELLLASIEKRSEERTKRSFRNQVTEGVGNPLLTGQKRRTINPSTTRKSCPMVTMASSMPCTPITRPLDDWISGFSTATDEKVYKTPILNHFETSQRALPAPDKGR